MEPLRPLPEDLAPGDARARDVDWSTLRLERIRSPDHPLLPPVHARLWREFGDKGEMEVLPAIAARLARGPGAPEHGHALRYELLVVLAGDEIVAMRDHTAIVPPRGPALVHLSHALVEPPLRGGGLSGWLRALPLQTARACAAALGRPTDRVTLLGEMEHPDGTPDVTARLRSYARGGFRKLDPTRAPYLQPDLRDAAEIARGGGPRPVPLALVVRRVGDEAADAVDGDEVRDLVTALYTVFGAHVPAAEMAPLWARVAALPGPGERVPLLPLL